MEVSYSRFGDIYESLIEARDTIEKNRVLTNLINNSVIQNKLISDLQSNSTDYTRQSVVSASGGDDPMVKELSDKIQPLQE